jgi:hypothetical protein
VTATFTAIPRHTLTVSKGGTGTGSVSSTPAGITCGEDCTESYEVGTSVALTAAPAAGSLFGNWTGACSGTGACNVTMNTAVNVGAVFNLKQPFTLTVTKGGTATGTVTSSPAGITCGGDCSEVYFTGDVVTLTASAPSGSYFANWTGACTGGGTCTMTMNADTAVGATFNTFTIDIDPGRGTVRMPNKYRTAPWSVGGAQLVNYVLVPPGWTVGGSANVNYVAVPPGWTVGGGGGGWFIAVPPGWSVGGTYDSNWVAYPPTAGWGPHHDFAHNAIVLPPGWSKGAGTQGHNAVALPPGWSAMGTFGVNYVAMPPFAGWTLGGSGGYNHVGLGPNWSASRGSNGPNTVVVPPGWSTFGGISTPNVVTVPPGWTSAGSTNSANVVSYPTTDVANLEIAFNDPGWIAWFQALKTGGVMSDSDIADVVIYVLGGGKNSRRWNNNTNLYSWGWQGAAPSGQWP